MSHQYERTTNISVNERTKLIWRVKLQNGFAQLVIGRAEVHRVATAELKNMRKFHAAVIEAIAHNVTTALALR